MRFLPLLQCLALLAPSAISLSTPRTYGNSIIQPYPPVQDNHTFTFPEFLARDPATDSFRQPYFRFMILFRQNRGLTEDAFHRHWKNVHADLTLTQEGVGGRIKRYVQFHVDTYHRNLIQPLLNATNGALVMAPYDGIAEFHTVDYAHFEAFLLAVFADPVLVADQQYFVDGSGPLQVLAGYDNLIYGSAVKTSGGVNGIMPGDRRLT